MIFTIRATSFGPERMRGSGDHQEHELPRQRDASETVVELRSVDGGRIVLKETVLQVPRQDHQDARRAGEQEHPLRKSHRRYSRFSFMQVLATFATSRPCSSLTSHS